MQKLGTFILFITMFVGSQNLIAQFNDYNIKGGVQGFGLLPETDFANSELKASFLGRAFLRFKLFDELDLEAGAGYGILSGEDPSKQTWETNILPADIRLLLSPFDNKTVNPYVYAGGGIVKWEVNKKPNQTIWRSPYSGVKEDGIDLNIPFGLGFEVKVTNALLIDISGGYNYVFSDDLNYYNNVDVPGDGGNDGFWNFGVGVVFTGESGSSDVDLDGLTLDEERIIGTDSDIADTDGDGLVDGLEYHQYKTDPLKPDTDGDGISDYDEIRNHATNPNSADSDNDKISDGEELLNYKTDPLRPDSDLDGISDYDEINKVKTNPVKSDTDEDGIKDGVELEKYKTSPTKKDSDSDGISDGDEILKYNTNPLKKDTDNGTISDFDEIQRGTNPLNPEDDIILDIEKPIILDGVTFATGSSELTPESEKMLMQVLNTLNAYPNIKIEIRGYTDNVGSAQNNQRLSQRRANSVRYWLLNKGVNKDRVIAKGYGEDNPIADNSTKEGRRLNRRIEFRRID